jgi:Dephospho-CoA kinase
MTKIVIYGLSGSGKSSIAKLIQDYYKEKDMETTILKLAYPLYEIQNKFYTVAGKKINFFDQDQLLLESIATHLRKISATSLIDNFIERLRTCTSPVVLNDDIRDYDTDYPVLKKEGFIFIRIICDENVRVERLSARKDLSVNIKSDTTNNLDKFEAEWTIDTSFCNFDVLKSRVHEILGCIERRNEFE